MADSVAFALPTLPSGSISPRRPAGARRRGQEQPAAIISAWLEHATALAEAGITGNTRASSTVTSGELVIIINDVQGAIRTVSPGRRRVRMAGAGPGGICTAVKLKQAGIEDFVLLGETRPARAAPGRRTGTPGL